jgi:hypothetical protein
MRFGIGRVKSMLGVYECSRTATLLHFGNGVERERGLTARFWAVNFDNTAFRYTAAKR